MNGKSKTISVIVIAVLLAAGIIGGVSVLQQRGLLPGISSSTLSTRSGTGTLVLLLHDPPHVPANVSAVYVTYTNIAIHLADDSQSSGWIRLNQSGTINLMTVVNFTQTIAKVAVGEGTFNLLRMNLSSVIVTYNSHNYTATVSNNQLTVAIIGGLELSSSTTSGAVIDIAPTILMYSASNSSTSPQFTMIPSAKAYVVPSNDLSKQNEQVGNRENDDQNTWLTQEIDNEDQQTVFNITSAAISNTSLSVTVKNMGNTSVFIQSIFITPNSSEGNQGFDQDIGHSILFSVLSNGTLVPFSGEDQGDQGDHSVGYNLSAGSSVTFTYNGQIPPVPSQTSESGENSSENVNHVQTNEASSTTTIQVSNSSGQNQGDESSTTPSTLTTTSITTSTTTMSTANSGIMGDEEQFSTLSIVSGQSYVIGVTSGDFTSTTTIVAS